MDIDKLKSIICEQLDVKDEDFSLKSSFQDDFDADSLDVVELVMSIEDEFDVEIPDNDAEALRTVQDAVDWIESNK